MKIAVILYKTNTLASGEHPLMVRITQHKIRKYVSLGLSCHPTLWDFQKQQPRKHRPQKKFLEAIIAQKTANYHAKFLELTAAGKTVSPEALVQAVEQPPTQQTVFSFFDELIARLVQSGKIGNANVYRDARRVLKQFVSNQNLVFTDIDQRFLNKYEAFLRNKGLADTSMSVYFRTLRAVFSKAIQEGHLPQTHYPFKEFNISKFNTTTQKRAITKAEIHQIARLAIVPTSPLYESQQYFLFSYYGQGINFRDLAFLKWGAITEGRVFYRRAKTGKRLQFKLLAPAQQIIDHYRPQGEVHPDAYIFPILNPKLHITPTQIDNRLDKVLKRVNKGLKELAREVGITVPLTMYVARHTYATVLKKSGVAIPVISEAMGHENAEVTQTYLKSFEDEVIDEANGFLL